jgi:glycosyltransferase involved in cell wall biosynthesis
MKILLIGKYPPMQGGIATKTYWLFKELEKKGFDFRAVTVETEDYSIKGKNYNRSKTTVLKLKKSPWHIPESELIGDRILSIALRIAESFKPDVIETNYLWPFCMPSIMVADILGKPLMIRHAGSDIQKFIHDNKFRDIMKIYFRKATIIVTNHSVRDSIKKIYDNHKKINCLRRYIPNPKIFKPVKTEKTYDILFTGKINYKWDLKGINHLINLIKDRELKSLFVIGGKYKNDILEIINQAEIIKYIEVREFVLPNLMPSIYNSCKFVWSWDEKESVEDFSNIIWEALFCGTSCIVNSEINHQFLKEGIPTGFNPYIYKTSSDKLMELNFDVDKKKNDWIDREKVVLYDDYIKSNIVLYKNLAESI